MGRQENFTREAVLEKALPVFCRVGFAEASLHELEQATGVNKSGLYAEFKDKEDLFVQSLRYYLSASYLIFLTEQFFSTRTPTRVAKAIGIRRLQRSGRVAFASQAVGGDLARPLTDRRLDTPSGIRLEVRL
jgi:AcrR family transcriptional regulator